MGAAVARPDRLAVVVIGDGGLLMSLGEIDAAIHLGVPMLIVVIALSGCSKSAARGGAFGRAAEARLLSHKVTQTPQIHACAIPETYSRGTCLVLDIHHDSGHHDSSQNNIGGRSRNRELEARTWKNNRYSYDHRRRRACVKTRTGARASYATALCVSFR